MPNAAGSLDLRARSARYFSRCLVDSTTLSDPDDATAAAASFSICIVLRYSLLCDRGGILTVIRAGCDCGGLGPSGSVAISDGMRAVLGWIGDRIWSRKAACSAGLAFFRTRCSPICGLRLIGLSPVAVLTTVTVSAGAPT